MCHKLNFALYSNQKYYKCFRFFFDTQEGDSVTLLERVQTISVARKNSKIWNLRCMFYALLCWIKTLNINFKLYILRCVLCYVFHYVFWYVLCCIFCYVTFYVKRFTISCTLRFTLSFVLHSTSTLPNLSICIEICLCFL